MTLGENDTAWHLDSDSNVPLHLQLAQRLEQQIRSGKWRAGDQLPSERSLMQRAGVSRSTIRQALESLERRGMVHRVRGRGTFAGYPKHEQSLEVLYSFHSDLIAHGIQVKDEPVELTTILADDQLADQLGIEPAAEVIVVKRLRLIRDTPMLLSHVFLPQHICPQLAHEKIDGSLYRLLSDRYGLRVARATDRLEAIQAGGYIGRQLGVSEYAPLMFIHRTAYASDDTVLHIGHNYIRADMVSFRAELRAENIAANASRMDVLAL